MSKLAPSFLVLSGDGINCEKETKLALDIAGVEGKIIHIKELMRNPSLLKGAHGLALPGGFSFGDELGSGKVLALKLKNFLHDQLYEFVEQKRPIIGICNGFQVLTKLGLLPDYKSVRTTALAENSGGKFLDSWVSLKVNQNSVCVWTKNLGKEEISLPIRHGEGRVVFVQEREKEIYRSLKKKGQIPLEYSEDINGSYKNIAGICDPTGLILGLMPHPEAALYNLTTPNFSGEEKKMADGLFLFSNIVDYLKNS